MTFLCRYFPFFCYCQSVWPCYFSMTLTFNQPNNPINHFLVPKNIGMDALFVKIGRLFMDLCIFFLFFSYRQSVWPCHFSMTLTFKQLNTPIIHFPEPKNIEMYTLLVKIGRLFMDLWHFYAEFQYFFLTVKVLDLLIFNNLDLWLIK